MPTTHGTIPISPTQKAARSPQFADTKNNKIEQNEQNHRSTQKRGTQNCLAPTDLSHPPSLVAAKACLLVSGFGVGLCLLWGMVM